VREREEEGDRAIGRSQCLGGAGRLGFGTTRHMGDPGSPLKYCQVPSIFHDFNSLVAFLWGPKRGANRGSNIGKGNIFEGIPSCRLAYFPNKLLVEKWF
jgi:hypothetical protein